MNYKTYFKGKKVAVIGLGPHGEMITDIRFLIRAGAIVSLYEIRSEARIQGIISRIPGPGLARMSIGKIDGDELLQAELIILSPDISKQSLFLKKANQAEIPIEFPHILFLKSAPVITLIGVMGASGKSTVAHLLYGMFKKSFSKVDDHNLYFIDPDLPYGALIHLRKIKAGDIVLARIPEDMMNEYHVARISPHVAVITTLTADADQKVKNAFAMLDFQTYNNFIVAPDDVVDALRENEGTTSKAKMLRTKGDNASLATQTAELFKVDPDISERVVNSFVGLRGHHEHVKRIYGIDFYNDSASVNPISTLYSLKKLVSPEAQEKNIVLIFGGAYTSHDYSRLILEIPRYVTTLILLPGSATLGFRADMEALTDIDLVYTTSLDEAVTLAKEYAKKGDKVLFSPGCEVYGMHMSRKERGEKFVKLVRGL